jgi:trehalose-6-phosphate synthase
MVHRINEIWPGTVQFQEQPESRMKLPQRLALMRAADVILVTPLRDGLNLLPLVRYVEVYLSEFALFLVSSSPCME